MFSFGIRTRLTLIYVLIFGSTTLLFSSYSYYKLNESLLQDFDNALFNYSIDISQTIHIGPKNDIDLPPLTVEEGKIFPFPSGTALIQVRHISGKVLIQSGQFGTFSPPYKSEFDKIKKGAEAAFTTIPNIKGLPDPEATNYRIITFPLDSISKPRLFLQIAAPMVAYELQIEQIKNLMAFGFPALLLIAILSGLFMASRALKPVQQIIDTAREITAEDLHKRIQIPKNNDEIKFLAETLNDMLQRIEKSFESQERFVADASHQLLTPVTIIKGVLEVNLKSIEDEKQKRIFKSLLQEVDNLTKIIKDMLLLARIESDQSQFKFKYQFIDEVLLDCIAKLQNLALKKNIILRLDFQNQEYRHETFFEPDLIQHLFVNIIENAIKFSPENTFVLIKLEWTADHTLVQIIDNGPGIEPELAAQIFNRFSRGTQVSKIKGFGLGLAIASKIASLHKTEIIINRRESPDQKGTQFEILFNKDLK